MTKAEAVAFFDGNQSALARALGIRAEAVAQWIEVPPLRQLQIEHITKRALRADPGIAIPNAGASA